jgi:cold shock CspA family protein
MNTATRIQGIVRTWKTGYGFIRGQDGEDYFVHHAALRGRRSLMHDQLVEFSVAPGIKGPEARDVYVVEEALHKKGPQ